MSNSESPAGGAGGPVPVPDLPELPEKMRVHALAKLLGRTSREVLAALADLSVEVRGAQSNIDRKAAEQVVTALAAPGAPAAPTPVAGPPAAEVPAPAEQEPGAEAEPAPAATPAPARRAPLTPVFAPPAPLFQAPTRPARTPRRAAPVEDVADDVAEEAAAPQAAPAETTDTAEDTSPAAGTDDDSDDDDSAARRRRRRGRRGRGRGRSADDNGADDNGADDSDESDDDSEEGAERGTAAERSAPDADSSTDAESGAEGEGGSEDDDGQGEGDSAGSRRRRRRRRRKGSDDGDATDEADPPNTVTRVRAPREAREQRSEDTEGDGVQSVRGSTRLEAKRQRRRDGRDAGRRRVPILSEAEFLARRESVDRTMVVRERGDRVEIGVLEDDVLVEHFIAGRDGGSMVGNIYLGRVQNVLPSMEAAFVDIGRGRNAVLYAGEVDWDAAGLGGKARRIEQALSSGDPVLVQVTKDPIGHKGARLTTQISLAGRFLVYVPSGGAAGISRKLPDVERKRLKDMLKEIVPSEAGVIIRTASEGVSHEALERDVRRLQAQWEVVKTRSEQTGPNKPKAPVLLYEEPDLLIKVVRDQFNEDFSRLVIEGDDAWDTLHNYIGHVAPELVDRLHRHVGSKDVFGEYRIDEQLLKALDRKVWLPSGGTLVIDRTEAMTVIDVNTGKFTGSGGNLEETVTRNNLEAAEEVVRQLRLRDIGGIIVIDFIDMVLEANRDLVLRRLTECLSRDRTRHQVAEVTSLGLVQMTRKRVGGGLLEHFSTPCEHCRGRGVVVAVEPVAEKSSGSDRGAGAERTDGPDREGSGRRGRGRGRGRDSQQADSGEAGTDVGAPIPVVEPSVAVVEAAAPAPAAPAPAAPAPAAPVPAATGADPVADAVEEVVVERSVTAQADGAAPAAVDGPAAPAPAAAEPAAEPPAAAAAQDGSGAQDGVRNGVPQDDGSGQRNGQPRPRRRGRVTRTAGAPAAATGETPAVAVVTVPADSPASDGTAPDSPASDGPGAEPVSAPVAPQPEPTVVSRPRRARRAASRPAGPPVADAPADGAASAGGDPV